MSNRPACSLLLSIPKKIWQVPILTSSNAKSPVRDTCKIVRPSTMSRTHEPSLVDKSRRSDSSLGRHSRRASFPRVTTACGYTPLSTYLPRRRTWNGGRRSFATGLGHRPLPVIAPGLCSISWSIWVPKLVVARSVSAAVGSRGTSNPTLAWLSAASRGNRGHSRRIPRVVRAEPSRQIGEGAASAQKLTAVPLTEGVTGVRPAPASTQAAAS